MAYTLRISVLRAFHKEAKGGYSKVGHVFVVLGDGENSYSFGMYPLDPSNLIKMWHGPGIIQTDDAANNPADTDYQPDWSAVFYISEAQFDSALSYAQKTQSNPPEYWGLNSVYRQSGDENCVTFAIDVLAQSGVIPSEAAMAAATWPADVPCAFQRAVSGLAYNQTCTTVFDQTFDGQPLSTCCTPGDSLPGPVMFNINHQLRHETPIAYTTPLVPTRIFKNSGFFTRLGTSGVPAALQITLPMGVPPAESSSTNLRGSATDPTPVNLLLNDETIANLKSNGFIQDPIQKEVFKREAVGQVAFEWAIQALQQTNFAQSDLVDNGACEVQVQMVTTEGKLFGTDLPLVTYCREASSYFFRLNAIQAGHLSIFNIYAASDHAWIDFGTGNDWRSYGFYEADQTGNAYIAQNDSLLYPIGTSAEPDWTFTFSVSQDQFKAVFDFADRSISEGWVLPEPYCSMEKRCTCENAQTTGGYVMSALAQAGFITPLITVFLQAGVPIYPSPAGVSCVQEDGYYSDIYAYDWCGKHLFGREFRNRYFFAASPMQIACDLQWTGLLELGSQTCSEEISYVDYSATFNCQKHKDGGGQGYVEEFDEKITCCSPQISSPAKKPQTYIEENLEENHTAISESSPLEILAIQSALSFGKAFATNFSQSFTQCALLNKTIFGQRIDNVAGEVANFFASWGVFNLQSALFNIGVSSLKLGLIALGANPTFIQYSCQALSLGLSLYSIGSMSSLVLFGLSFASGMVGSQIGTYFGKKVATVLFAKKENADPEKEKLLPKAMAAA